MNIPKWVQMLFRRSLGFTIGPQRLAPPASRLAKALRLNVRLCIRYNPGT